jgi:signal transduction histidine kinase/FixJ family two-component response regulator
VGDDTTIESPACSEAPAPPRRPDSSRGIDLGLGSSGLTFQNRIAVVALSTAVAVLMGACLLFMFEQWRTERTHFINSQKALARVAAGGLSPQSLRDPAEVGLRLNAILADRRVYSAAVVDVSGHTVASATRSASAASRGDGETIVVQAPIVSGGVAKGEFVIRSRTEGLSALLPRFISMGGALFFVAAGLALFMGRWLAARLARPVDRLSRAMYEVARSGDFARRVHHGENDEFGRLTESFNALLAQLYHNDRELKVAMDALVEARDAAEAANVLKSHFLANMSHEIRTPLNGVLTMAEIMAMGELASVQRERLAVIHQSGEALLNVLNDILDLSKIEAGRMELEDTEFDTASIASQIEAVHRQLAAQKGLAFSLEMESGASGKRRGDVQRLQQILNNLVSNAIKFTSHGEVRVRIEGEGPDGSAGLRISVSDTGIGIPADKLPLLFQKFTQVDSSTTRKYGGTGLGLAICRELAQLMGGQVCAKSVQGEGSTFTLSVPLARSSPESLNANGETSAKASAEDVAQLKILAAEDNATNQLVLKTVLATFGLEVDIVGDGAQAVEAWAGGGYDLILMDIQMPVMDGITATRAIRNAEAQQGLTRTPIIALSANAMTHQVKEYLAAGMDMHVAKPIQLGRLHQAFEAVLNGADTNGAGMDEETASRAPVSKPRAG